MKTLEAFLKARGYQGGTHTMMISELQQLNINDISEPYQWGLREGRALRHGNNITTYPVPVNSWDEVDNEQCTVEYIAGLAQGIYETVGHS